MATINRIPPKICITSMSLCLDPTLERKLEYQRRGISNPSNYLSKNKSRVRRIERQQRRRREHNEEVSSRPVSRSKRYDHVGARVFDFQQEPIPDEKAVAPKREFLRKGTGKGTATTRPGSAWGPRGGARKIPMRASSNNNSRPSTAPEAGVKNINGADVLVIDGGSLQQERKGKENVGDDGECPPSQFKSPVPKLNISRLKTADRLARATGSGRAQKPARSISTAPKSSAKPSDKPEVQPVTSGKTGPLRPRTASESVGLPQEAPMEGHPLPKRCAEVGMVPEYLKERKQQWAQQRADRIANMPDPDCPPGHRLLPEQERIETLRIVKSNFDEFVAKIGKLPVTSDTLRSKMYRKELEDKIAAAEAGIKLFSRRKVFVQE